MKTLIVHNNLNSFGPSKLLVCEGILLDAVLVIVEMICLQECWIERWQAFKYRCKSQNVSEHCVQMWGQQILTIE
jgi:hypothetical protein